MTATRIVPQDTSGIASDAELAAHEADTTAVHGIADTSLLSTTSHVHAGADITSGTVADARIDAALARDSEVTTAVSDHAGAANPHPTYETAAEVLAQIGTHEGLADPHPGYLTPAEGNAAYEATGAVAAHTGDAVDAHDASAVSVVPAGGIAATDVQAAIEELDTEKSGTAHTHTHVATTGQTVDDHHARDHAINAAVHTGTLDDAQIPAGIARDSEVATAVSDHAALADPHTGYVREADASWIDLTDGGATTLHSHAGGAGATGGTATLDFGAFPGATDTSVAVTGQAAIVAGSLVEARLRLVATATHSADEHWVENLDVSAGNIVAGTGFTIYGRTGDKTRRYGTWTIAWTWQ